MTIKERTTKEGRLVTRLEVTALCDEPSCTWKGEMRSMKATAERDLAEHVAQCHGERRMF